MHSSRLAPQARPQALAELESRIAEAERVRDHHYGVVSRVVAAGQNARAARVLLELAEERVAQLQRSREVLVDGERERGDEDEAEAS